MLYPYTPQLSYSIWDVIITKSYYTNLGILSLLSTTT